MTRSATGSWHWRRFALSVVLGLAGWQAQAQQFDVSPFATGEIIYDDNLFRVESAPGANQVTDVIGVASVGLTGEFSPGLQAMNLTGLWRRFEYKTSDELNHDEYQLDGRWEWKAGRRFEGLLRAQAERSQDPFEFRDGQEQSFTVDRLYELTGTYHLNSLFRTELSTSYTSRAGSDPDDAAFDLDEQQVDLAGFYRRDPIGELGLGLTLLDGEFPHRSEQANPGLATSYRQYSGEVRMRWSPSAISTLNGAIGVTRREQTPVAGRDFSAATGRLDYNRSISGRTRVGVQASRRIWSTEQVDANFATDSGIRTQVEWQWSVKTRFRLEVERRAVRYQSDVLIAGQQARKDDISRGRLTAFWQPLERLGLQLSGSRERRDSNQAGESYEVWVSRLTLRLGF